MSSEEYEIIPMKPESQSAFEKGKHVELHRRADAP